MASTLTTTPAHLTAAELEARFRSEGLVPGTPPGLKAETCIIDRATYRRLRCARCRRGGLEFRPYHFPDRKTGRSIYRVVAACVQCGQGTEL